MRNVEGSTGPMNNRKATYSLIFGILLIIPYLISELAFALFGGIGLGLIGLVFGLFGLWEINRSKQLGKWKAILGILLNIIGIFGVFLLILVFIIMDASYF